MVVFIICVLTVYSLQMCIKIEEIGSDVFLGSSKKDPGDTFLRGRKCFKIKFKK